MASESPPPSSDDVNPPPPPVAGPSTDIPPKSDFVNSEPIREDQVQNAIKFLSHPRVKGSPIIHRRNFLERKGLTKEEIDEAFRRVPDSSSDATSAQANTSQDGQVRPYSNIRQQGSAQTIQPAGGAPSGVISTLRSQFHWYHAFLAIGFLAASGAGTVVLFKKSIIPGLRSWIRKVVSDDGDDDSLNKTDLKPSLNEEAAAAAKAAAAAAADAAKASQEMVILKSEEKQRFEQFMSLLDNQLQELKSMKTAVLKLEGQNYNSGRGHQVEEHINGTTTHSRQPLTNGRADYDSRSARPSSPPFSSEPLHPKSYMEIMDMVQRGERPPNVRDINDAPPNPNQPISNPSSAPRSKPWETVQPARTTVFDSQTPYTTEGSTSAVQNESSSPWWQQKNVRITEIENENDHHQGTNSTKSNGDIPINQPPQRKWVPPQPPPVAIPESAIAIRQPKPKAPPPKERTLDSTSSNGSEIDELQKVTRIAESGGEPEMNGGGPEISSTSEIQEEQVAS